MAKSFLNMATGTRPALNIIGSAQEVQEVQEVQQVQEVQEVQEVIHTQGRKGMKAQRINMAFTPANIEYVRTMASITGKTMTQYVNELIAEDRQKNGEVFRSAEALKKTL